MVQQLEVTLSWLALSAQSIHPEAFPALLLCHYLQRVQRKARGLHASYEMLIRGRALSLSCLQSPAWEAREDHHRDTTSQAPTDADAPFPANPRLQGERHVGPFLWEQGCINSLRVGMEECYEPVSMKFFRIHKARSQTSCFLGFQNSPSPSSPTVSPAKILMKGVGIAKQFEHCKFFQGCQVHWSNLWTFFLARPHIHLAMHKAEGWP